MNISRQHLAVLLVVLEVALVLVRPAAHISVVVATERKWFRHVRGWLCEKLGQPLRFVLPVAIAIVASYGWGWRSLYQIAAVLSYAGLCVLPGLRSRIFAISPLVVLVVSVFDVSVLQCSSVLASCLLLCGQTECAIGLLISHALPFLWHAFSLPRSDIFLSPLFALCCFVLFPLCVKRMHLPLSIASAIVGLLYGISLMYFAFQGNALSRCVNDAVPYGYQIGDALEQIVEEKLPSDGQLYYANEGKTAVTNCGTIYLDHDSNTVFDGGLYSQYSPWGSNELIAAEPYRVAFAKDGCLVLNLGSKLAMDSGKPLWGQVDNGRFCNLCSKFGDRVVMGDSDMVGNLLSPYQFHLLRMLKGADWPYRCWILSVSIFLVVLSVFRHRVLIVAFACIVLCFPFSILDSYSFKGVRYVGRKLLYPHTTLGYGVVRAMQRDGHNVLFTSRDADLLVVGEGSKASLRGERVVVLEPNAKVEMLNRCLKAGDLPLGRVGEVPDARNIMDDEGRVLGRGTFIEGGVKFIASGSPAEVDYKRVYATGN